MNGKKIIGFLLCRSAFTQRNMTSLMLVAIFFGVYVLAGGKITTKLPDLKAPGGLSTNDLPGAQTGSPAPQKPAAEDQDPTLTTEQSKAVLGIIPSAEREKRENAQNNRYKLFSEDETKELEQQPIDRNKLVKGTVVGPTRREQIKIDRQEKHQVDMLSEIEERLKKRSMHNY